MAKSGMTLFALACAVFSFSVAWAVRPMPGPQEGAGAVTVQVIAIEAPNSIGALKALSVDELRADDPRFGGWSDVRFTPTGVVAISDQGHWLAMEAPPFSSMSVMAEMGAMRDGMGAALGDKRLADAEGLALLPDGRAAVSFEGRHRIDFYDVASGGFMAPAAPGPNLIGAQGLGGNTGLEALALLPDGRLLAGAESGEIWLVDPAATEPVGLHGRLNLPVGWALTAAAAIDDRLYLVWRFFNPITQTVQAEIRRCVLAEFIQAVSNCDSRARLAAPFPVDNIEAIDLRRTEQGVELMLMSDNNYAANQRTLIWRMLDADE